MFKKSFIILLVLLLGFSFNALAGSKPIYQPTVFFNAVTFQGSGEIQVDTTNFNNYFYSSLDTVQKLFDFLDDFNYNNVTIDTTNFNNNLSIADNTLIKALETIDNLNIGGQAPVESVNNQTGAVSLYTTHITEGTNLYYTETRVSNNTDVSANTTHRGRTDNPHNVTSSQTATNTTNFGKNLSSADNTTQKALDTIDDLNFQPSYVTATLVTGIYSSYDVSGKDIIKCDVSSGEVTINSFANGIDGQVIRIIKTSTGNNLIVKNQSGAGGQELRTTGKTYIRNKKYLHTSGSGAVFTVNLTTEGTADGNTNRFVHVFRTSDGQCIDDAVIVKLNTVDQIDIDLGLDQNVKVVYSIEKGNSSNIKISSGNYGGATFICSGGTEWIQLDE